MPTLPRFGPANFPAVPGTGNEWFPLVPGRVMHYAGSRVDEDTGRTVYERNDLYVTPVTRDVAGVTVVVVRDTDYEGTRLVEDTLDYYAQDLSGNVWYLGEDTTAFEYDEDGNFEGVSHEGAWLAGVDGASPGWIMPADPVPGLSYYQEFFPGEAEDEAAVLGVREYERGLLGKYDQVLKTLETTALEPDVREHKYYAPGVGLVRIDELDEDGEIAFKSKLRGVLQLEDRDVPFEDTPLHDGLAARYGDVQVPSVADFTGDGGTLYLTWLGGEAGFDNALGFYGVDMASGEIGEAHLAFPSSRTTLPGTTVPVAVAEDRALGLFLLRDAGHSGVDLGDLVSSGLNFADPLDGGATTLGDELAPLAVDSDGVPLPLVALHALDADPDDALNLLNPAGGVQAVTIDPDTGLPDGSTLLAFEDLLPLNEHYDGNFADAFVLVSPAAPDAGTVQALLAELDLAAAPVV